MEKDIKFLTIKLEDNGVATAPVKNGHIVAFTALKLREMLADLYDKHEDSCVIFIPRQNYMN